MLHVSDIDALRAELTEQHQATGGRLIALERVLIGDAQIAGHRQPIKVEIVALNQRFDEYLKIF